MILFLDSVLGRRLDEALTTEGAAYVEAWDRVFPGSDAESLWVGGAASFSQEWILP